MDMLIDLASKFGAPAAPILAIFLVREVLRNKALEEEKNVLVKDIRDFAERSVKSNLEVTHSLQTLSAIINSGRQGK